MGEIPTGTERDGFYFLGLPNHFEQVTAGIKLKVENRGAFGRKAMTNLAY